MKSPLIVLLLTTFLFSCSKSVEIVPETVKTATAVSNNLVRNLDSTVLTVTIVPVLLCYSYSTASIPKPCDKLVDIRFELSRPISAYVNVELTGSNMQGASGSTVVFSKMGISMAPNTRKLISRAYLTGAPLQYASDIYRITSVSVYKLIH